MQKGDEPKLIVGSASSNCEGCGKKLVSRHTRCRMCRKTKCVRCGKVFSSVDVGHKKCGPCRLVKYE